jgi:hypothetical protein
MAASDYVSETPKFTLALKGASTDGERTSAIESTEFGLAPKVITGSRANCVLWATSPAVAVAWTSVGAGADRLRKPTLEESLSRKRKRRTNMTL